MTKDQITYKYFGPDHLANGNGTYFNVIREVETKQFRIETCRRNAIPSSGLNDIIEGDPDYFGTRCPRSQIPFPFNAHKLEGVAKVVIVEGEKCAAALQQLFDAKDPGCVAITNASGAGNAGVWAEIVYRDIHGKVIHQGEGYARKFLQGKIVTILSDNDEPGEQWGRTVAKAVLMAGCSSVWLGTITSGMSGEEIESYDIADLIKELEIDYDQDKVWEIVKTTLHKILRPVTLQSLRDEENRVKWEEGDNNPFPIDLFPPFIQDLSRNIAQTTGCPTSFIALSALSTISVAMGYHYEISYKSWDIPCFLSGIIVAPSGAGKSQATRPLVAFFEQRQVSIEREKDQEKIKNSKRPKADQMTEHELMMNGLAQDIIISDTTNEALAFSLAAQSNTRNQHGILWFHDEIDTMLGGLGRYSGAGDADRATFTRILDGRGVDQTRVTIRRYSPMSHVALLAGAQTDLFIPKLKKISSLISSGFLLRVLYIFDDRIRLNISKDNGNSRLDPLLFNRYESLLEALFKSDVVTEKQTITLSESAGKLFEGYEKEVFSINLGDYPPNVRSYALKTKTYALQIALYFHVVDTLSGDPSHRPSDMISGETMDRAIKLTRWFFNEFQRLYRAIEIYSGSEKSDQEDLPNRVIKLLTNIRNAGEKGFTKRDAQKMNQYKRQGGTKQYLQDVDELFKRDLVKIDNERVYGVWS